MNPWYFSRSQGHVRRDKEWLVFHYGLTDNAVIEKCISSALALPASVVPVAQDGMSAVIHHILYRSFLYSTLPHPQMLSLNNKLFSCRQACCTPGINLRETPFRRIPHWTVGRTRSHRVAPHPPALSTLTRTLLPFYLSPLFYSLTLYIYI